MLTELQVTAAHASLRDKERAQSMYKTAYNKERINWVAGKARVRENDLLPDSCLLARSKRHVSTALKEKTS